MSYRLTRAAAGVLTCLALSLFASSQAFAARPDTSGWSELTSPGGHFLVHYQGSAADAQTAAGGFESAYATEVGSWGFSAPLADADGLIDVYLQPTGSHLGESYHDDPSTATTSGYVILDPGSVGNEETIAHELFHLIQYSIYAHGAKFLVEGTAEWAGAEVAHTTTWLSTYFSAPEQSLECAPGSACAPSPEQDLSYSRWIFFDHLSEHYGPQIVAQILARAGALSAGTDPNLDLQAIDDVLAAHGSSLAQEFDDFTAANASGSYGFPGIGTGGPHAGFSTFTGVAAATLPDHNAAVDHLAAGYVRFQSGDTRFSSAGCGAATLHVSVTMPAEAESRPVIADSDGAHPLNLGSGTASIDLPWTTCTGSSALLALPNASRTLDGAQFVVHTSLTATPPKVRVSTAAPRVHLHLHRVAHVAAHHGFLRFNVLASRRGILTVLVKPGYVRGSFTLHKGLNRIHLRLRDGLRRGRHQVVLTVYSTTGARGKTYKRSLKLGFRSAI